MFSFSPCVRVSVYMCVCVCLSVCARKNWKTTDQKHMHRNRVGCGGRLPHRFLTAWTAHVFGSHGIFNLLNLRPELLSLNQFHAAKCPVCEYGSVICVGFLQPVRIARTASDVIAMAILSVHPSVRHVPVFCPDE